MAAEQHQRQQYQQQQHQQQQQCCCGVRQQWRRCLRSFGTGGFIGFGLVDARRRPFFEARIVRDQVQPTSSRAPQQPVRRFPHHPSQTHRSTRRGGGSSSNTAAVCTQLAAGSTSIHHGCSPTAQCRLTRRRTVVRETGVDFVWVARPFCCIATLLVRRPVVPSAELA